LEPRNPNSFSYPRNDAFGNKRNHGVDSANRKLIRPSLTEFKEQQQQQQQQQQQHFQQRKPMMKRPVPPEQTNAENFYYVKQMQSRTPMVVVLQDGEELHGVIEWYDRACIKMNRVPGPNLLVYKSNIKYLYKESDKDGSEPTGDRESDRDGGEPAA